METSPFTKCGNISPVRGHPKAQNPEKEGPRMPEPSKMNLEAKLYFNSLPPVSKSS